MTPLNPRLLLLFLLLSPVVTAFNLWELFTAVGGSATVVGLGFVTWSVVDVGSSRAYYHFFTSTGKSHLYPNDVFEDVSPEGNAIVPDAYSGKPVTDSTFTTIMTNGQFPMATTSIFTNTLVHTGKEDVLKVISEVELSTDVPPFPYNKCPNIPFPPYFIHRNLCPSVVLLESLAVKPNPIQILPSPTDGNVPVLLELARSMDQYVIPIPQLYPIAAAESCMSWVRESLPVHLAALRFVLGAVIEAWNIWLRDFLVGYLSYLSALLRIFPRAIVQAWNYWPIFWAVNFGLGILIQIAPFVLTNVSERYYQTSRNIHEKVAELETRAYENCVKELEREQRILQLEELVEEHKRQKKLTNARKDAELQTIIDLEEDQRKLRVETTKADLREAVQRAKLRGCPPLTGGWAGGFRPTEMGESYWNPGAQYNDDDGDDDDGDDGDNNEDRNGLHLPACRSQFGPTGQRFDSASIDREHDGGDNTDAEDDFDGNDNKPAALSNENRQCRNEYDGPGLDGQHFSTASNDQEHFSQEDVPEHLRGLVLPSASLTNPTYQSISESLEAETSSSVAKTTDEPKEESSQSSLEQAEPNADTSSILEPDATSSRTVGAIVTNTTIESEPSIEISLVLIPPPQATQSSANGYRETGDEDSDSDDDKSQSSKSNDDGEETDGVTWEDCDPSQPAVQGGDLGGLDAIITSMGDVALTPAPEDAMEIVNEGEDMDTDDVRGAPGDYFQDAISEYMANAMNTSPDEDNLVLNVQDLGGCFYNKWGQETAQYGEQEPFDDGDQEMGDAEAASAMLQEDPRFDDLMETDLLPIFQQSAFAPIAPASDMSSGYTYADELENFNNSDTTMPQDAFSVYDAAGQQQPFAQNNVNPDELFNTGLNFIEEFNLNDDTANGHQPSNGTLPQIALTGYDTARQQEPSPQQSTNQEELNSLAVNHFLDFNLNDDAANGNPPSDSTMPQITFTDYDTVGQQQSLTQTSASQDGLEGLGLILEFNQNFDTENGNQPFNDWQENRALGLVDLTPSNAVEEILQDQAQNNNAGEPTTQEQSHDDHTSQARLEAMSREELDMEINNDLLQDYESGSQGDDEISHAVQSPSRPDYSNESDEIDDDEKTVYDYESDSCSEMSSAGSELDRRPPHEIPGLFLPRQQQQEQQEQRAPIPGLFLDPQSNEDRDAEDDAQSDTSSTEPPENPDDWERPGYLRGRIDRALERIEPASNSLIPRWDINARTGMLQIRWSWALENPAWLRTMAGQSFLRGNPQFAIDHCWEVVNNIKRIKKAEKAARKE